MKKEKKELNFVKYRFIAIGISIILILVGFISVFLHKGLNLSIDFAGGVVFQVKIDADTNQIEIRDILNKNGFGKDVQQIGKPENHTYLIRIKSAKDDIKNNKNIEIIKKIYENYFGKDKVKWRSINLVGPSMSKQLIGSSWLLITVVFGLILLYVLLRFKQLQYSVAAIVALLHDSIITIGIFSILNKEISTQIVAAILTLIGYSLNDTIVVFSRIRENKNLYPNMYFPDLINKSINDTLSRTIVTSLTTFVVVLSIYIFGSTVTKDFALALAIGILVGTYSSIFIAAPILIGMTKDTKKKMAAR